MDGWPIGYTRREFARFDRIKVSAAMLKRIGLFTVAWAQLEAKLDLLFAVLFRLDPTYAIAITAGLNVKSKIAIMRTAAHNISDEIGTDFAKEIDEALDLVGYMAVEWRNNLAHAQYNAEGLHRFTNNNKLKGRYLEPTVADMDEAIGTVTTLSKDIHELLPDLIDVVAAMTPADFDRVCAILPAGP